MLTAYTYIIGPLRAISSESDCRSRSHEFDPTFVAFDHEIVSTIILPLPLTQEGLCHM